MRFIDWSQRCDFRCSISAWNRKNEPDSKISAAQNHVIRHRIATPWRVIADRTVRDRWWQTLRWTALGYDFRRSEVTAARMVLSTRSGSLLGFPNLLDSGQSQATKLTNMIERGAQRRHLISERADNHSALWKSSRSIERSPLIAKQQHSDVSRRVRLVLRGAGPIKVPRSRSNQTESISY